MSRAWVGGVVLAGLGACVGAAPGSSGDGTTSVGGQPPSTVGPGGDDVGSGGAGAGGSAPTCGDGVWDDVCYPSTPGEVMPGDFARVRVANLDDRFGPDIVSFPTSDENFAARLAGETPGTFGEAVEVDDLTLPVLGPFALGDYDGDGYDDLAILQDTSTFAIHEGIGDGTFSATSAEPHALPEAQGPIGQAFARIGSDPRDDWIVTGRANDVFHAQARVYGSGPGPTFPSATRTDITGGDISALGVGRDLSGNVLAVSAFGGPGSVRLVPAFFPSDTSNPQIDDPLTVPVLMGAEVEHVAVGDLDGVGGLDVAVTSAGSDLVMLVLSGPSGAPQTVPISVSAPAQVELVDLDGGGGTDVVIGQPGGLRWMRNLGDGQFAGPVPLHDSGAFNGYFATTDLNADGAPDFVLSASDSGIALLLSDP